MKLTLYTTLGCHLCEDALRLIHQIQLIQHSKLTKPPEKAPSRLNSIEIQEIDIADSTELVAKYGIRIPVVQRDRADSDLGWPFSLAELAEYLDMEI